MIRFLSFLILALAAFTTSLAQAYDVLVLLSRRNPVYEETLKGFNETFRHKQRVVILSDYDEIDVTRIVREDHPGLILTIGDHALAACRKIHQTPLMALMALGVHNQSALQPNLTGVGVYIRPDNYMSIFSALKTKRVGVLYNPAKSGWYLLQARQAARRAGVELITREIQSPKETIGGLSSLAGQVEALWMLPDTIAVTRETAEAYFRFSQERKIPVISFANAYLSLGAAAVLEIKSDNLGRQAGKIAATMMRDNDSYMTEIPYPDNVVVKANYPVLRQLGLDPNQLLNCGLRTE